VLPVLVPALPRVWFPGAICSAATPVITASARSRGIRARLNVVFTAPP